MKLARLMKLATSDRGAAIIELALIAPILAAMVAGIVDMSNAFSRKLTLEQGVQRAIERIEESTATDTVENTLKNEVVCQVNGTTNGTCNTSPITTANVTVTFRLECTDGSGNITAQSNTDPATFDNYTCAGGTVREAKYFEVKVTNTYTPLFPLHFYAVNADGTYHLSATAGMRTS